MQSDDRAEYRPLEIFVVDAHADRVGATEGLWLDLGALSAAEARARVYDFSAGCTNGDWAIADTRGWRGIELRGLTLGQLLRLAQALTAPDSAWLFKRARAFRQAVLNLDEWLRNDVINQSTDELTQYSHMLWEALGIWPDAAKRWVRVGAES